MQNVLCDVSNTVVNSKTLIVSGMPISVIFQNLVTYDVYPVDLEKDNYCMF